MDEANDHAQLLESTRFWIQQVFVPILVCLGVGGNTITVIVLTRRRMRCSTNIYLTALAIADILYLLFVFFLSFTKYKNSDNMKYALLWRFYGLTHWLCDAASNTSVWLIVSFTLERYIAVCHPIKGKTLCTEKRAKSIIVLVTIFCLVTTVSTAFEYELTFNETSCLRNCTGEEMKTKKIQQSSGNSFQNTSILDLPNHNFIVLTNLQNNKDYDQSSAKLINEVYTKLQPKISEFLSHNCTSHPHTIYIILNNTDLNKIDTDLIEKQFNIKNKNSNKNFQEPPEIVTTPKDKQMDDEVLKNDTCCNKQITVGVTYTSLGNNSTYKALIYWYSAIWFTLLPLVLIATFNCFLIHAVYRSQSRRRQMTNSQIKSSLSNENRITIMLIGVVILFLICQMPTAGVLIYENFHEDHDLSTKNILLVAGNVFNLLVTINASCNFLLYCVLSKKFRATFKSLFCERKKKSDTIALSSSRSVRSSQHKFNAHKNGFRRNVSEYRTPRNLETQSLTSIPRSKSLMMRPPGKAKSSDLTT